MDLQANNNFGALSRYKKVPSPDSTPQSAIDAFFKEFPHKRVENKTNHGIPRSLWCTGTKEELQELLPDCDDILI